MPKFWHRLIDMELVVEALEEETPHNKNAGCLTRIGDVPLGRLGFHFSTLVLGYEFVK